MARFQVIEAEVDRARKHLGIRAPVSVWVGHYTHFEGRYIGFRSDGHRIGLESRMSPRRANRTLWHELVHARQVEQSGSVEEFDREWDRQVLAAGVTRKQLRSGSIPARRYVKAPFEAEAERVAKKRSRHAGALTRYRTRPGSRWARLRRVLRNG